MRSDDELVQGCLAGDEEAWGQLVRRYGPLVRSQAFRVGLPSHLQDEVCQDVFLVAFRRLETLRSASGLSSWLLTTSQRRSLRILERERRYQTDGGEPHVDPSSPPEADLAAWEQQREVRLALERLGGRCERLLRALFLDPSRPDYRTVASRLRMPVGSIGPVRRECLGKLARVLEGKAAED